MISVVRGDSVAAAEHYRALQSFQSSKLAGDPGGIIINIVAYESNRLLGLISQTMGNLDQASAHFEDALAFCRPRGYRLELAWTCCDYADLLRERDAEGDRSSAMALLDESLAISSELGMRPLMERVLSRREILGA